MKAVITTINPPTEAVKQLAKLTDLIVIGDDKTPSDWEFPGVEFIPVNEQNQFNISELLPKNHYSRKNIGYLVAMKMGAELIYDTDDDNIPNENWKVRTHHGGTHAINGEGWHNVYKEFIYPTRNIWPRGFPLNQIDNVRDRSYTYKVLEMPIQQGMADGSPDVDAIYRLTTNQQPPYFTISSTLTLGKGVWCPFNSQSTWFFKEAFPLMYLPVYATFRMTDIWRSFVAQRCLWQMGSGVTFHSPAEVFQKRNEHDLMKDFEDEIPGYLHNERIAEVLGKLELGENIYGNMVMCYESLIHLGVLPIREMECLKSWIKDCKND